MDPATYPYRLLAPGPVPVPPTVLRAMSEKVLHHRTPQFQKLLKQVWLGLQNVFATKQSVQILTGTGSAAMEAAIINTLSSGDEALVVVSGKVFKNSNTCPNQLVTPSLLSMPRNLVLSVQACSFSSTSALPSEGTRLLGKHQTSLEHSSWLVL